MIQFIIYWSMVILLAGMTACRDDIKNKFNTNNFQNESFKSENEQIIPAADRTSFYYPKLKNKNLGLIINHTSRVGDKHIVDSLLSLGITISKIFTPEHGFSGSEDAGQGIDNSSYGDREIPVISLYGNKRKPSEEDLGGVELMVFDIQDVGVRFYTYISTLHYVMEACAENGIPLMVLDRPNPNGFYVDGPVLEPDFTSFVGMHQVPVVHGMTIGEYARMMNGEGWLTNGVTCDLEVIPCLHYDHTKTYELPIKPSPNLPNLRSVLLYPSLCLFEGTTLSIGRGTDKQFQLIGHPDLKGYPFFFTPESRPGATEPRLKGVVCFGMDLSGLSVSELRQSKGIQLQWILEFYRACKENHSTFFLENRYFDRLAGTKTLASQIEQGLTEQEIKASWQADLDRFKKIRNKYLLYPDF